MNTMISYSNKFQAELWGFKVNVKPGRWAWSPCVLASSNTLIYRTFTHPKIKLKRTHTQRVSSTNFLFKAKTENKKENYKKSKNQKKLAQLIIIVCPVHVTHCFLLIINFLFFSPYTSHTWSYIFFCFMIKSREENAEQIRTRRRSTSLSKRRQTQIAIKNKVNQTTSRQV